MILKNIIDHDFKININKFYHFNNLLALFTSDLMETYEFEMDAIENLDANKFVKVFLTDINKENRLFDIIKGKVHDKKDMLDNGKYPLIGASKENNGIVGYMNTYDYKAGLFTLSSFGTCGYLFKQNENFNIRGHGSIIVLNLREQLNDINLHLITLQLREKYNWTNAITYTNINKIEVYIYK